MSQTRYPDCRISINLRACPFFALCILVMLALLIVPTNSWVYQDGTPEDMKFERFGPRADKIVIRLYANDIAAWDALARGEIDIADWSLSKPYYDLFTSGETNPATGLPYTETINVVSYGSEAGLFILDLNNNPNPYLGNPPDPSYPNPVYPNPTSVKEMRQAIAYLVDRSRLDTIIGSGFYTPLYTVVPPYMGAYSYPEIRSGGSLENLTYPYSRANAEAKLDGGFPVNMSTGWRFWDRNNDGIEQPDEYLELKFVIRNDSSHRLAFGNFVADELNAVKVRVNRIHATRGEAFIQVMVNKDFHLYTGGWGLGMDPDHLILWSWDYYWHPGFCYNYAGCNNETFNEASLGVQYATTQEEALPNAHLAQRVFAEQVLSVPLWSYAGSKAMSRYYTGGNTWQSVTPDDGENQYRGQYWKGVVNRLGYGIDDFFSFLNMHPANYPRGDGENMTIRWGFKVPNIKSLNPNFAGGLWDWNVLSLIYESLIVHNPYNIAEFIPWLAEDFEVGTYTHPIYGECTKVRLTLRAEATWHDGTPLTTADVYFTWVELPQILRKRVPPPWPWPGWCPWMQPTVDFEILDPYNFEILFEDKTVWILSWLSSTVILPKHIWKPIAENALIDVLTGFAPDPNMIGSGPWRFVEYVENSHILLVANRPCSTVQTNLPNSIPVTSSKGYWRYYPVTAEVRVDGTTNAKIDYYTQPQTINYTLYNLYLGGPISLDISFSYPDGTTHSETGVVIAARGNWTHSWTGDLQHVKTTSLVVTITSPTEFEGVYSWSRVYYGTLISYQVWDHVILYRMVLDTVGSTFYDDTSLPDYPYKWELLSPDIKVDIKDIAFVARAFGSYPGHERWEMGIADVNGDYKVDIKDIATIASGFGWTG